MTGKRKCHFGALEDGTFLEGGGGRENDRMLLCIVCSSSLAPRGREGESSWGRCLEEFCHQLRINDESFLEALSDNGSKAHQQEGRWTWTSCPTCFPLIEKAVNKRRDCLVIEDRVNQLQHQILRDLRKLKEEMGQFYLDLKKIESVVRRRRRDSIENGQFGEVNPFRKRVFEVVRELQVYQTELDVKLLPTEEDLNLNLFVEPILLPVKEEESLEDSIEEDDVAAEDPLGYYGTDDINNGAGDNDNNPCQEDGANHISSDDSDFEDKPPKRNRVLRTQSSTGKKSSSSKIDSHDMEWNFGELDKDAGEDNTDPGSDQDFELEPLKMKKSVQVKPKRTSKRVVKNKVKVSYNLEEEEVIEGTSNDDAYNYDAPVKRKPSKSPASNNKKKAISADKAYSTQLSKLHLPPCLTKEDRLRADHDAALAGLSYLRKYFILRSQQKPKDHPPPPTNSNISNQLQGSISREELLQKSHTLEYDPSTGKVALNGIEIFINEEEDLLQCSSCPYQITNSEATSKLKQNKNQYVAASRMEQTMADHVRGVHQGAFNCRICGVQNTLWRKYFMHVHLVHFSLVNCDICGKPLNRRSLEAHKYTHLSQEEKKLQENPRRQLDNHHRPQDNLYCEVCGKKMKTLYNLNQHKKSHLPDQGKVVCQICGKRMRKTHYEFYHKRFTCPVPEQGGAIETGQGKLEAPPPQQLPEMKCVHCPSVLKNWYCLKQHIAQKHSAKADDDANNISLCPICGKGFKFQNLKRHIKAHENDKYLACGWGCGEEFKEKRKCMEHETICSAKPKTVAGTSSTTSGGGGEKDPHNCSECTATLKNKQSLRQHMKRFHSTEAQARAHGCGMCDKRFRTRGDLTDHLKRHREERPYECCYGCGKAFKMRNYCTSHEAICKARPLGLQ